MILFSYCQKWCDKFRKKSVTFTEGKVPATTGF
jgi:hypothetical protein